MSYKTNVLSSSSLNGDKVTNSAGEDLGKIEDLMVDLDTGRIRYAVVSFGGFMGLGDKLFAVPWSSMSVDTENECIKLNVPKEKLEDAPGFEKDDWPNFADPRFGEKVYGHYSAPTYW